MPLAINISPVIFVILVIAALAVLAAVAIKARAGSKSTGDISSSDFRVDPKAYFFTRPENAFYTALVPIAQELGYCVFPKVGLKDIFQEKPGADRGQYNRYAQMHVDYLLVTRQNYRPVAGIELNGASHERERQRTRDMKKSAVFGAGKLPLIQFSNGAHEREIQQQLQVTLGRENASAASTSSR